MSIPTLLPVRGLTRSMSRLRQDLPDTRVDCIVERLLDHTINSVNHIASPIIIITADRSIRQLYPDLTYVFDKGDDLNTAISTAISEHEYDKYLLVMPDLPGVSRDAISKLLHLAELHEYLICPTSDNGTAAGIFPSELFGQCFLGQSSANKFASYAKENEIPLAKIIIDELKVDLDDKSDYDFWKPTIEDLSDV